MLMLEFPSMKTFVMKSLFEKHKQGTDMKNVLRGSSVNNPN